VAHGSGARPNHLSFGPTKQWFAPPKKGVCRGNTPQHQALVETENQLLCTENKRIMIRKGFGGVICT